MDNENTQIGNSGLISDSNLDFLLGRSPQTEEQKLYAAKAEEYIAAMPKKKQDAIAKMADDRTAYLKAAEEKFDSEQEIIIYARECAQRDNQNGKPIDRIAVKRYNEIMSLVTNDYANMATEHELLKKMNVTDKEYSKYLTKE